MRYAVAVLFFFTSTVTFSISRTDSTKLLLEDTGVQIDATAAVNAMYNFDFDESARLYRELRFRHPKHPLSFFLSGLNLWWMIMPDEEQTTYDDRFMHYMDTTIAVAMPMLEHEDTRIEAAFFFAAAYGFKARLL